MPRGVETRWYSFENPDGVRRIWLTAPGQVETLRGFVDRVSPTLVGTGTEDWLGDAESGWEIFETTQAVCATAYWYQVLPSPRWPALEPYAARVKDLGN